LKTDTPVRTVAVYSARLRTVTVITATGTVPLVEDDVLDAADRIELTADVAEFFGHVGDVRVRIAHNQALSLPIAEARALAQSIRAAFTIPAHVAGLVAEGLA
jgi:hypothetical protein